MSRIFITGSSEGLGLMAGQLLASQGHEVVLHARNAKRADDARRALPQVAAVVVGDVSTIVGVREVAAQADAYLGAPSGVQVDAQPDVAAFDAVIHNVAVGYREPRRITTADGLPHLFAINTLAPYLLTALMRRPKRLIYLSSGMHHHVDANLDDLLWTTRRWDGSTAYAESKLHDAMLAFAMARRWPETVSSALEPGWVPTRMGGRGAPDDMDLAHRTQAWLAVSEDAQAKRSGAYWFHQRRLAPNPQALDAALQDRLLARCAEISGVAMPT
ncbi:short-chain dehydrogenase [Roseateles noduli]|nr:short-chain dehydrogenase [Roseateles noduli]